MDDILAAVLTASADFAVGAMGEDGAVVMDKKTGDCFELNRTGALVWRGLQRGQTGREVLDALVAQYRVPGEQIEADLRALLSDLLRRGMLAPKSDDERAGS